MASRIWCARVVHEVEEARSDIYRAILDAGGTGFVYVTQRGSHPPHQRLLNIDHISSVEAVPGDPI